MRRRDTMDSEACGSGNESLSISRQSSQQMLVSTPNFVFILFFLKTIKLYDILAY